MIKGPAGSRATPHADGVSRMEGACAERPLPLHMSVWCTCPQEGMELGQTGACALAILRLSHAITYMPEVSDELARRAGVKQRGLVHGGVAPGFNIMTATANYNNALHLDTWVTALKLVWGQQRLHTCALGIEVVRWQQECIRAACQLFTGALGGRAAPWCVAHPHLSDILSDPFALGSGPAWLCCTHKKESQQINAIS